MLFIILKNKLTKSANNNRKKIQVCACVCACVCVWESEIAKKLITVTMSYKCNKAQYNLTSARTILKTTGFILTVRIIAQVQQLHTHIHSYINQNEIYYGTTVHIHILIHTYTHAYIYIYI